MVLEFAIYNVMTPRRLIPIVRRCLALICSLLACLLPLAGQDVDGSSWQEKPGFALVKPQPWSPDNLANVVEFQAFTDRTVKGRQIAGYFVFRNGKTANSQVPAGKIVKLVVFPAAPAQIARAEQRAALQKIIDEYAALGVQFPAAVPVLEKFLSGLRSDAAKFDAGSVKDGGKWIPGAEYRKKKADELANLLRMEITGAQRVRDLNLMASQYYVGLEDLAKTEPAAKAQLDGVRAQYESLRRKEERSELLAKLVAPNPVFENSELYVRTLKTLKPSEDPAARQFIELWDRSLAKAAKLNSKVEELKQGFEKEMAAKKDPAVPVSPSNDIVARIHVASQELNDYRAGTPPAAIQISTPQAEALAACSEGLAGLAKQLEAREYFDAKVTIAGLIAPAGVVGPNTLAVVEELQKQANSEIAKFQSLRDEAKAMQDTGKANEALMKYREAWAVMPDKDVAAIIETLKK